MLGKADTPANEGKQEGVQAETEGDKTLGKRKDSQEGGRTIQQRETRRGTMGDKTVRKADTPSPKGNNQGYNGKHPREGVQQRETRRGTMGDKGRQDRRQGEHTFQQGESRRGTMGGTGRQDPPKGRRTIQQRETRRGRRNKKEGVQWETIQETRPREGGHTIQHQGGHLEKAYPNSTLFEKMQNQTTHHKGKQEERQVGRQAGRQEGRQAGRQRRQRRQNIGKVDAPSNTEKQEGRQWETRGRQDLGKVDAPRNTGHTYLGKQWKAMKTKTSGRWTIQHRHMWGDNWRQRETMGDNGKHVETTGDKDR